MILMISACFSNFEIHDSFNPRSKLSLSTEIYVRCDPFQCYVPYRRPNMTTKQFIRPRVDEFALDQAELRGDCSYDRMAYIMHLLRTFMECCYLFFDEQ